MADDGSIFLAGYTEGDWEGVNAGDADFAAVNLHTRGSELWRYQVGMTHAIEHTGQVYAAKTKRDCICANSLKPSKY